MFGWAHLRMAICTALTCSAVACATPEPASPKVFVPADGRQTPPPASALPVLPARAPGADAAATASVGALVRDFCLRTLERPAGASDNARALGAIEVANPWFGESFREYAPAKAWSLTAAPRVFFWIEPAEVRGINVCWLKSFDGQLATLAPIALNEIERYAAKQGFGKPIHKPEPLSVLLRSGTVERAYGRRNFQAGLSWDRSDPAAEGFDVIISATPVAPQVGN
jgi:hypothetical protein